MVCENCLSSHEGEYGSGRFCCSKCARCYSTKSKRAEINERVSSSLRNRNRNTFGTDFLTCPTCQEKFERNHFIETAKKFGKNKTKFCSENCKIAAKLSQSKSPAFRQKLSDAAVRRLERGDTWFGKQNFIEAFGKSIRCDSLLERSFVLTMTRDARVKDVKRSDVWISYTDNFITRRYNPDFIVEFVDGKFAIAEVKSERMGRRDVWEDYRAKSVVKRKLLEEYAHENDMTVIWYTQTTSPQTYREVCTNFSADL